MPVPTETLRTSFSMAASVARAWFEDRTESKNRDTYFAKGQLGDEGGGAVYVYFAQDGKALYVGQTGRTIKSRQHDQASPHKEKWWWEKWSYMRFIPLNDEVDRLALESLLIAAYEPPGNEKPQAKSIADMFPL